MPKNPTRPSQTLRIDVLPRFEEGAGEGRAASVTDASRPSGVLDAGDFGRLFMNAYDATLITDACGMVLETNARAVEILQYPADALRGRSILSVISGADEALIDTVRRTLTANRFLRISAWCGRSDGAFFAAEIAVNKLLATGGERFCFFLRDETVRKRAEEDLRTTHNAMRNAGTGIAVGTLDGQLIYVNPALCRLWREPSADVLLGQSLSDLLGDACAAAAVIEAVQKGRDWQGEVLVRSVPGGEVWVQAQAAPNFDSDNQLIGLVLSIVDIRDRKRAEQAERAVEQDRVMMQSLGAVCHHLGQPATVLLSSIELMERARDRDPEVMSELLKMSSDAANTLRQTLRELNDLHSYRTLPYLNSSTTNPVGGDIIDLRADEGTMIR
jgi:PAS domain S-box-containing protein